MDRMDATQQRIFDALDRIEQNAAGVDAIMARVREIVGTNLTLAATVLDLTETVASYLSDKRRLV